MAVIAGDEAKTRWDLTTIYPALDAAEFRDDLAQLATDLDALAAMCERRGVRRGGAAKVVVEAVAATLTELVELLNRVALRYGTLDEYLTALVTTDSQDTAAEQAMSKCDRLGARWRQLVNQVKGWIGAVAESLPTVLERQPALAAYRFLLEDAVRQSRYLMSDDLEALAAEMALDSGVALRKLQGTATCQIEVPWEHDGQTRPMPITELQNLSHDADPAVRERAYRAEVAAWHSIRTVGAACLNGVKGTALTLARRRGRATLLDEALDQNQIDRATLDAMLGAIRDALPMFRRYLQAKGRKLGQPVLRWWDLDAPVGASTKKYSWDEAREFLVTQFAQFDDELAAMTATSFDRRWIDGLPRKNKRVGAYCMPVERLEESRILANFDGSFDQLSTLAHELGHAFHNHCQRGLAMLLRGAPSTLAETASIFCETLIAEQAAVTAEPAERLMIREAQLAGAAQVCVDISSRFLFESAVFERRAAAELSADEFCSLLRDAQAQTYGDGLDPATYHPYMWLWKPHYYSYDANFYNFPYAFGHLFSLGLYAVYQREGAAFVPRYKALLRDTGQSQAAPLAARFGIDLRSPQFWRDSLDVIARQLAAYEALP